MDTPVTGPASALETAKAVLSAEAAAIQHAAERLAEPFPEVVRQLASLSKGGNKLVVMGVGKSGFMARKVAASLSSTGTPALYLHPTEALHGDLGIYRPGDATLLFSKSGTTSEILKVLPGLKQFRGPVIGVLGNLSSPLAKACDYVLDAGVHREADTLNLAPTTSTTVALALGDALTVALMAQAGFTAADFARFHPSGQLGNNLLLTVRDKMHPLDEMARSKPDESVREVLIEMTHYNLGATCIVAPDNRLLGIFTDGDLRRTLLQHPGDPAKINITEVMTQSPTTISAEKSIHEALEVFEAHQRRFTVLPVVKTNTEGKPHLQGLLRLQDIYSVPKNA